MKLIPITQGKFAMVDDEDYDRLAGMSWIVHKKPHGATYAVNTYKKVNGKRGSIAMQRFIMNEFDKSVFIDHINRDPLDNRKENLRRCTRSQNCMNRRRANGKRFKGVFKSKCGKYFSSWISANGRKTYLGMVKNEEVAAVMYDMAAIIFHGEFAALNYDKSRYEVFCDV
jgi:hypothetical protein